MATRQLGYIMQITPTQTMQQTQKTSNKPATPCIKYKKASTDLTNEQYPVTSCHPRYIVLLKMMMGA